MPEKEIKRGRINKSITFRFDGIQQSYVHPVIQAFKDHGVEFEREMPVAHKYEPVFGSPLFNVTVHLPYVRSFVYLVNSMARIHKDPERLKGLDLAKERLNKRVATVVKLAERRMATSAV